MSTDKSHPAAYAASLRARREEILNRFEYDLYERQDFSTPSGYPNTLRDTLQVLVQGDLSSEIDAARRVLSGSSHHYWFRAEFQSLVYGLVHTLQTMLDDLVVATADDMNNPPPVWRFESLKGCLVDQFCGPKSHPGAFAACGHLAMRCSLAIRMYRVYRAQILEKLASPKHISTRGLKSDVKSSLDYHGPVRKPAREGERVGRTSSHVPSSCSVGSRGRSAPLGLAGGQTSLVSSRVDVESPSSRDTVKFLPRDAGPSTKDLDAHSDAHRHALAQRDRMRANAEGQTAVSSCHDVKLRHVHSAEEHAPQLFPCDAVVQPKPVSSSSAGTSVASSPAPTGSDVARGSDSPKESGLMSSATLTFSPTHDSPDLPCALSREMKARNLRGVDVPAVQEAHIRLCSESRGQVLSPSRKDAQAAAPCAPLAARAINPLGARAEEAAISGEIVAEDCEQRQILDFKTSGGGRAVDEESEEGITCRSSADVCDLTNVALPRQSGEKAARPNAPIHAHAMVVTRARISSHSSREGEKGSPQSAEARRDRDENPEQLPDLDGQRRVVRARAESLSPSSSSAPRRQTTCEPPDKTTSNDSSLHSCEPPLRLRSSTVSSSAPLLRSSHHSTSGRGPDSANWRARGRPTASPPWEVNTLDADSQSKSISERERGLEVSDLQEDVDVESHKARGVEKGLSQSAEHSCDESPARFPDLDGQCHALQSSADSPSPSSSTASRHQAARKPPDKTTLKTSSLHRSESGPDSVNWRTRGRLATLSPREVSTLGVGLRSKGIDERKRERASEVSDLEEDVIEFLNASGDEKGSPRDAESDRNVANFHHPRLQASSQASAQGSAHVYAGGQVSTSSRRDGKPESACHTDKCSPQVAESDSIGTDTSIRAHAMVKPRAEICSRTPERPLRSGRHESSETDSTGSNGQDYSLPLSDHALSSLSSTVPHIPTTCKTPEKTFDRSSPDSCRPAQQGHPASVPSSVPLPRSSRRSKHANELDSVDWRARGRPVTLKLPLREIDAVDLAQQIASSPRKGMDSQGAPNGKGLSLRPNVADAAPPSASWLCFLACGRRRVPKPLELGASDLKRVHAGGQTVVPSCEDVKPLVLHERKELSPRNNQNRSGCAVEPTEDAPSAGLKLHSARSARTHSFRFVSLDSVTETYQQSLSATRISSFAPTRTLDVGFNTRDVNKADTPALLSARGPPDKAGDNDANDPAHLTWIARDFNRMLTVSRKGQIQVVSCKVGIALAGREARSAADEVSFEGNARGCGGDRSLAGNRHDLRGTASNAIDSLAMREGDSDSGRCATSNRDQAPSRNVTLCMQERTNGVGRLMNTGNSLGGLPRTPNRKAFTRLDPGRKCESLFVLLKLRYTHNALFLNVRFLASCSPRDDYLGVPFLVSQRGPPDKQRGRDVEALRAEKLPNVALPIDVNTAVASVLGCVVCPDTTSCLGGEVSSTNEDESRITGWHQAALLFSSPTHQQVAQLLAPQETDLRSLECLTCVPSRTKPRARGMAQITYLRAGGSRISRRVGALPGSHLKYSVEDSRPLASGNQRVTCWVMKALTLVSGSPKGMGTLDLGVSAQLDARTRPVSAMHRSSESDIARRNRANVRLGSSRIFSTCTTALKCVPQASCIRSLPLALAPLISRSSSYAGEVALISDASMSQQRHQRFRPGRTYQLISQTGTCASTRAKTETWGSTGGRARDDISASVPAEPIIRVLLALLSISRSSGTIRDYLLQKVSARAHARGELARAMKAPVLLHALTAGPEGGCRVINRPLPVVLIYAPRSSPTRARPMKAAWQSPSTPWCRDLARLGKMRVYYKSRQSEWTQGARPRLLWWIPDSRVYERGGFVQ